MFKSTIIVSHYREDVTWLNKINSQKYEVVVYSKTQGSESRFNYIAKNLGHEAAAYLKYIIDNYQNLRDHNFFIHGHNIAEHQDISHIDFFERVKIPPITKYFNFNRRDHYTVLNTQIQGAWQTDQYNILKQNWQFGSIIPINETLGFYPYAQFYVHKDLILKHTKNTYTQMYNWLMSTSLDIFWSSRIFEWMWHKIFTNEDFEKQLDYKDIF